jgi:hypothetical protein
VARDYRAEKEDEKTQEAEKDDAKQKKGGQKRKRSKKTKKKTNKKRKVETSGSDTRVEESSSSPSSTTTWFERNTRKQTEKQQLPESSSSSSSPSSSSSSSNKRVASTGAEKKKDKDKKRASKKKRTSEKKPETKKKNPVDRGPLIADFEAKIKEKTYPGAEQPSWYEEHWRHKVQVTIDSESMTLVRFRSAIWRRDDYGDRRAQEDIWETDTIEGIVTAHRLTRAAVQGLLTRLVGALRSGDEIRNHTWTEDVADGAKTRSGKETTEMIETDTVSLRRYILTIDIISLVFSRIY